MDVVADVSLGLSIGRREENKRLKEEALLACGLRCFADVGYESASIEQIAANAGVARGTFYLYFPDKLSLFDALVGRFYEPLVAVLDRAAAGLAACDDRAAVRDTYQAMAIGLASVGVLHRDELMMAFREARQPGDAGRLVRARELGLLDRVVAFTDQTARRGLLDVPDARVACLVVYGAVERLFYEVLSGTDLGDPAVLAREVLDMFARAMGLDRVIR